MADPYSTNPYLQMPTQEAPSPWMALANLATGIGTGISQGAASGRGWASGLAPGIMYGNQLTGLQQQQAQQDAMKRWQLGMMAQEYAGRQQDRMLKLKAQEEDANRYLPPGLRAPSPPLMGQGTYDTKLAGYEGGAKSGGMVYNELGSGAGGPYQIMPATWTDIRVKNPDLNLPEVMPVDNSPQTRAMHDAAHARFKAGNAQALQAAGFQPTPDNLYLAHRFGAGGATSVLRADPNKPLIEILPPEWQRQNPDMRGQTAGGFRRLAAERMQGVGVPYEAPQNAQPTQYALQPNALPSFDDPALSLSPRPNSRFMPGVLPNSDTAPSFTAPVMPQPQATMQPAQFTPPAQTAAPASDAPPKLVLPPKPELPEDAALSIYRRRKAGAITASEARAEADKITGDLWTSQKDQARAQHTADLEVWKQRVESGRFDRGQTAEQKRHERDLKERQEAREVPSGYRKREDGALEPTPGGPADPIVQRRERVPTGYRNTPDGGLEPIPGGPADPARKPDVTPEEMKKLRTARTEAATIVTALEDFKSSFKKAGTMESVKSVAGMTTPVNTAYNTAALLAKGEELFNLGVLNGPDLDIIRRTLPDPSTMRGASTSVEDMEAAVDKVVDLIQTRVAAREGQLGLPVTNVRELASTLKANRPADSKQTLQDAKNAIMKGAPRDKVIERLRSMGVDPGGL